VLGNSGTSLLWNWTRSLIAQYALHRADDRSQHRAFDADREIDARRPLSGVFTSSMTLMPPTKAMRPSTAHSLRCRRRSRCERNCTARPPPVVEQHDARGDERSLQRARE